MPIIPVPLDAAIVEKANVKLQPYGMTVEQAVHKFVADIAGGQGAIPYLEIPNQETKDSIAEIAVGKSKRFDSVEALMADLTSEED